MAALIGALRVSLSADTAAFEKGMNRAQQKAEKSGGAINKAMGGIKAGIAGLAAGITVSGLASAANDALEYASSLGEVAQQLGVTTKDLQVYRYAATQVGISQEEMDKGLAKLTQTIGKAQTGSKQAADAFAALGIKLSDIEGKTAGQVIPLIADGLAKIPDPAKRAAIEIELFGRAGQKMDTLLAGGSRQINELSESARKLGIILSDKQIQQADETADKLAALKQVLAARIAGVVADNSSSILVFAESLAALADRAIKAGDSVTRFFREMELQRLRAVKQFGWTDMAREDAARRIPKLESDLGLPRSAPKASPKPSAPQPKTSFPFGKPATPFRFGAGGGGGIGASGASYAASAFLGSLDGNGVSPAAQAAIMLQRTLGNVSESLAAARDGLVAVGEAGVSAFERMEVPVDRLALSINDTLEHGLKGMIRGFGSLKDVALNVLYAIGDAIIDSIIGPLSGAGGSGGIGGAISSIFGSIFGGSFAKGGSPPVGKVSLVGERGPELFVPRVPGTIIPNHKLGGSEGRATKIFDLRGAMVTTELIDELDRRTDAKLLGAAPSLVAASRSAVLRDLKRPRM